jgi:hypothetical protein
MSRVVARSVRSVMTPFGRSGKKNSVIPSLSAPIYGGLLPKAATALSVHDTAKKFLRYLRTARRNQPEYSGALPD